MSTLEVLIDMRVSGPGRRPPVFPPILTFEALTCRNWVRAECQGMMIVREAVGAWLVAPSSRAVCRGGTR